MARRMVMTGDDGPGVPPSLEMSAKRTEAKRTLSQAEDATDDDRRVEGAPDVTKEMLDYHGADTNCSSCSHFTDPDQCSRPGFSPVEPGGWCKGYEGSGGDEDMDTDSDFTASGPGIYTE